MEWNPRLRERERETERALQARGSWVLFLRTRPPPTGVKIAEIGKRGFQGQKAPVSQCSRNRCFKISPFSLWSPVEKCVFLTQSAHFWGTGKWEFLTLKPSFPNFGDFDLCRGRTGSQFCLPSDSDNPQMRRSFFVQASSDKAHLLADSGSRNPSWFTELSGVIRAIRANRKFDWFMRIGLTHYKKWGFNCEWFERVDSSESRCESPMPLRKSHFQGVTSWSIMGRCSSRLWKPLITNREKCKGTSGCCGNAQEPWWRHPRVVKRRTCYKPPKPRKSNIWNE